MLQMGYGPTYKHDYWTSVNTTRHENSELLKSVSKSAMKYRNANMTMEEYVEAISDESFSLSKEISLNISTRVEWMLNQTEFHDSNNQTVCIAG